MRYIIAAAAVCFAAIHYEYMLDSSRWLHILLSLMMTIGCRKLGMYKREAFYVVFATGLMKEVFDPKFDCLDLSADVLGILIGLILL